MAPVDVTDEAVKAAPGIVGALVALRWMPGTPFQRATLNDVGAHEYVEARPSRF